MEPDLDVGGVAIFDHVETAIGQMDLQDGAVHQEFVDPRIELGGGVQVLVKNDVSACVLLPFMNEPPQPRPTRYLQNTMYIDI